MPRQPRSLTLLLLACALFLRGVVPTGWMPAAHGGAFAIEPCAAAAPAAMAQPMDSHHGSDHQSQHNGDCAFAPLHAGFAASAHPQTFAAPPPAATMLPGHAPAPYLAIGPPSPPPPATGPPAIA